MFDYALATNGGATNGEPGHGSNAQAIWSRTALSSLAPGILTPFSYSMMAEILRRGWYAYYDSLGFEPTPGARLLRQHAGRAYLNLTITAELESQAAGIEPLALRIDGAPHAVAPWEKPGLLAGLRTSRQQRKIGAALDDLAARMPSIIERARAWHQKTSELRWTQAEILQVMEEIERVGVDSLTAFFAARHQLEWLYHRLLWATQEQAPYPQNLSHLQGFLRTIDGCVEAEMATAASELATLLRAESVDLAGVRAGLHRPDGTAGDDALMAELPESVQTGMRAFLQQFGHRGAGESEIRQPRWQEDPTLVWRSAIVGSAPAAESPASTGSEQAAQAVLAHVDSRQQKEAQRWLAQIPALMRLQSQALDAFAYVRAGTRIWALAAAKEAQTDQRFLTQDDVFFFELEEVKEMMTGEWNISARDEIHATAEKRRQQYQAWYTQSAGELLLAQTEAVAARPSEPGAPGQAEGTYWPVLAGSASAELREPQAPCIAGAMPLDSGCAVLLPAVNGIVATGAAPSDPIVAVAARWARPCILTTEERMNTLESGATLVIDGATGEIHAQ